MNFSVYCVVEFKKIKNTQRRNALLLYHWLWPCPVFHRILSPAGRPDWFCLHVIFHGPASMRLDDALRCSVVSCAVSNGKATGGSFESINRSSFLTHLIFSQSLEKQTSMISCVLIIFFNWRRYRSSGRFLCVRGLTNNCFVC